MADWGVENYLKAIGLKAFEGDYPSIALESGEIIHMGHEPTVSLIRSILDLQQQIKQLQDDLYAK